MRSFIYFLLFLGVVTSSVYARKAVKVSRLDLLKDAASQMLKIPEFKGRMTWASGGVAIDEFINYLSVHETKVYNLYDSERGLRSSLGKALNDAMNRDIFSLPIGADGKLVNKYFRGAKPDLQAIISTVIAAPELNAKMQWGSEGLSTDEIIAAVTELYPEVSTLYVQISANKTDRGLRIALGRALEEEMEGSVFSLLSKADGKNVNKYFQGTKPDLQTIIPTVIANPELNAKMQWGSEGLSMDEIMNTVTELYPEVHTLYVQASANKTDYRLRYALGQALEEEIEGGVFKLTVDADGKVANKYFQGIKPDLQAIISTVVSDPELNAKIQWGSEGLSMDEIMNTVTELYPEVHTLYVQASANKTDYRLRYALGLALKEEMKGDVFRLTVDADGNQILKYFRGTKPDLQTIVSTVISDPELNAKMQWGNEGLIADEIIAAIIERYPEVYTLYMQISANKTELGFRTTLGKALDKEMEGRVFSWQSKADGKTVRKYFLGIKPDFQAIISAIIADPELRTKMQWDNEGLTIDEIVTAVIEFYPEVHTLYMQISANKTEHGLRIALGRAIGGVDGVVVRRYSTGGLRYFWKE